MCTVSYSPQQVLMTDLSTFKDSLLFDLGYREDALSSTPQPACLDICKVTVLLFRDVYLPVVNIFMISSFNTDFYEIRPETQPTTRQRKTCN